MSNTNTGGPAFPTNVNNREVELGSIGMTLRDYFAAKAMQGIYSHFGGFDPSWAENDKDTAQRCYEIADAMLKAREGK